MQSEVEIKAAEVNTPEVKNPEIKAKAKKTNNAEKARPPKATKSLSDCLYDIEVKKASIKRLEAEIIILETKRNELVTAQADSINLIDILVDSEKLELLKSLLANNELA